MQYYESMADLVGNTPLVRLTSVARDLAAHRARQDRVPQPGRVGEGPDRRADDRGGRGVRRAAPRRHDRRAHLGQHRRRAGHRGPEARLRLRVRAARQGEPGQDQRAHGVRRPGRGLPDGGRPGGPAVVLLGQRPAGPRDRRRLEARPVLQPEQPARRTTRPPARSSGRQTDGRITHFVTGVGTGGTISGTGRYLKEVSDGRVQVVGADPEGSVYSGGTGRPYLVEGVGEDFWPSAYDQSVDRRDRRGVRPRLVPDDPAAGPRGGPARRRLLRDGGRRRAAGRRAAHRRRRRRRAAARRRPRLPRQDLQRRVDGRLRLPRGRQHRRHDGR